MNRFVTGFFAQLAGAGAAVCFTHGMPELGAMFVVATVGLLIDYARIKELE